MKTVFLVLSVLFSALAGPATAQTPARPVDAAIERYIVPEMGKFAQSSRELSAAVHDLCKRSSPGRLIAARSAFRNAALAYARIEFLRIGPLAEKNRRERLHYWPDRRSLGLKQVQRALAGQDETVATQLSLSQKSVALQGFGALEFLLFGSGSQMLAAGTAPFRCAFAESVGANIASIAIELRELWEDPSGFQRIWTNPGPDNATFRNERESLAALVGLIANGFEIVADQRIRPIAPMNGKTKSYKRAVFWRAHLTRDFAIANLAGLGDLIDISRLADGDGRLPTIENRLHFEIDQAVSTLSEMSESLEAFVTHKASSQKLTYLLILLKSLNDVTGNNLAHELGLPVTFSPLDGD